MTIAADRISFQCSCGFRLERVPRQVVAELPRCLGCGRALRASGGVARSKFADVRDLR